MKAAIQFLILPGALCFVARHNCFILHVSSLRHLISITTTQSVMPRGSSTQQPPAKKQKKDVASPLDIPRVTGGKEKQQKSHAAQSKTHRYPAIKFSGPDQQALYDVLSTRKVLPNKYVDSSALEVLGIRDELIKALTDIGWSDLMSMDDPSYAKLTYEFLSSFTVINDDTLSFRIANVQHEITKSALANMFGWQLVKSQQLPEGYATPFWHALTSLPKSASYRSQSASSLEIVSCLYRYFARLMSYTIYGRAESNKKIQIGELALLYHFNDGQLVDWTNLLINRFLYQAKRAKGAIVLGGFVTRNDERLGVFNRNTTNLLVVEGWPTTINVDYLIGIHLLRRHKLLGLRKVDQKRGSIS